MRIKRRTEPFSSANITLPNSWLELHQDQLRIVFSYMYLYAPDVAKTHIFFRLSGMKLLNSLNEDTFLVRWQNQNFLLATWQIAAAIEKLNFLYQPNHHPVMLDGIGKRKPAYDNLLHGFPFGKYLMCENLYQSYLSSGNEDTLRDMANILYQGEDRQAKPYELFSLFLYWGAIKMMFSNLFPHLFALGDAQEEADLTSVMNAQIRALTGGDVTKEDIILNTDTWRALTELDAKVKELNDIKKAYERH